MQQLVPIPTLHLFPDVDALLINLLESLSAEDWNKQTLSPAWKVKDVAAHLLDGNIRSLSSSRDHFFGGPAPTSDGYHDVVQYLNTINQDWVNAMKRVSPQILITLLSATNDLYYQHLLQLSPFEKAIFPVAWAGETESQNWFHVAREYTEKWHHQQQIWHAVDRISPLLSQPFFKPYLDTSLRALPFYFSSVKSEPGDTFSLIVSGEGGGEWHLMFEQDAWVFCNEKPAYAVTKVHIDDHVIWRLLIREISMEELKNRTMVAGKKELADAFLNMSAVMI